MAPKDEFERACRNLRDDAYLALQRWDATLPELAAAVNGGAEIDYAGLAEAMELLRRRVVPPLPPIYEEQR